MSPCYAAVPDCGTGARSPRRHSGVTGRPQWNDGIAAIDVAGPFEVGTAFTMTPPADEPHGNRAGTDVKMTSEVLRKLEAKRLILRTVDAAGRGAAPGYPFRRASSREAHVGRSE